MNRLQFSSCKADSHLIPMHGCWDMCAHLGTNISFRLAWTCNFLSCHASPSNCTADLTEQAAHVQVCANVFDLNTDWEVAGAEQRYTVNPATGEVTSEARRRSLLADTLLQPATRALLGGGSSAAAAAASAPVSYNAQMPHFCHAVPAAPASSWPTHTSCRKPAWAHTGRACNASFRLARAWRQAFQGVDQSSWCSH